MKKDKTGEEIVKTFSGIFLLVFLFPCAGLFAMDWPSPSAQIRMNFGWNDGGLPHLGVSFDADGSLAAAEKGELLYRRTEDDTASRLPSPLGSWIALDHGDGIISVYSRFDADNPAPVQEDVEKGGTVGESGNSGWSSKKGFYFQLFDRKERRWINPSMIITAPDDTRPPAILSVKLADAQGKIIDPSQVKNVSQGRYSILVEAIDTMRSANENPLAPFRIICTLNGSEAGTINFDTYSARDGSLMVYRNGLIPVRQVYAPVPAYEAADVWFSRGQTTLEIIAQDIAGNSRSVVFRFQVE